MVTRKYIRVGRHAYPYNVPTKGWKCPEGRVMIKQLYKHILVL